MSRGDVALRALEREAQGGDPAAEVRLLVARLRAAPACERCGAPAPDRLSARLSAAEDMALEALRHGDMPESARRELESSLAHVHSARALRCPACAGTGSPFRARLELAAYCGSEAARGALGLGSAGEDCRDCGGTGNEHHACCDPECCPEGPGDECGSCEGRGAVAPEPPALDVWVRGLSRWADVGPVPGWVLVRAAVAAARLALPKYMADAHGLGINAHGRLYEIDPGEWTSRAALNEAMLPAVLAPLRAITAAEAWLDDPTEARWAAWHVAYVDAGHAAWLPPPGHDRSASSIDAAARLASRLGGANGDAAVRSAICSALTSWALETPA